MRTLNSNTRRIDLDNGCDEFQQKARHLEQAGEEVVEEVHDEAFDVGAVVVLIGHDHEVAVSQLLGVVVHLQCSSFNIQTIQPKGFKLKRQAMSQSK